MRYVACALLLSACALSTATAKEGISAAGCAQFASPKAAYNAGKVDGYRDGIAGRGKLSAPPAAAATQSGSAEICEAPPTAQTPSYSADYVRGYHEGYEAAYARGYRDARARYGDWGCVAGPGCVFVLLAVLLAGALR
jgi:hypothetical protein